MAYTGDHLEESPNTEHKPMSLSLISTHKLDLKHVYSFTVMPATGDIILWGEGPRRLLTGWRGNPCAFHVYNNTSEGWSKQRTIGALCKHSLINMLPVMIEPKGELLAVSCAECHMIRLHDNATCETTVAFNDNDDKTLGHMCHGEKGSLFVAYCDPPQDYKVLELGCTTTKFSAIKTYNTGISMRQEPPHISYIAKHKLIVMCSKRPSKIIRAVPLDQEKEPRKSISCEEESEGKEEDPKGVAHKEGDPKGVAHKEGDPKGEDHKGEDHKAEDHTVTWQHWYAYHSEDCSPSALHFSTDHDKLLVGDMLNGRLIIMDPQDGSHLQTITVSSPGWVEQICPYDLKWFHTAPPPHTSLVNRILCGGGSSSTSAESKAKNTEAPKSDIKQSESGHHIAMWMDNPYSTDSKQTVSFYTVN